MIKNLLSVAAAALLAAGSAFAQQEAQTVQFADVADCWVRTNNDAWKDSNADKLEFHKVDDDHAFYALVSFEYSVPTGMKVSKATLHFVTERVKAHNTSIRGLNGVVKDNDTYANQEAAITEAIATEPLWKGQLAGQWNMAIGDGDKLNEASKTIAAWENDIDVTSYVKSIAGDRVSFIFSGDTETGQVCIISKEKKADAAGNLPLDAAAAEELHPYLEVEFVEDANQVNAVLAPVVDTEVRSDDKNANQNRSNQDQFELKDIQDGVKFYGLMEFALPSEIFDTEHYTLNKVELRLFHKMVKGDRNINIHAYGETVEAGTNYLNAKTFVDAALAGELVKTYAANGQMSKACWDKGVTDQYLTAEAWTNYIDLTDYVKSLTATTARSLSGNNVAFVLSKATTHKEAVRVSSNEATDIAANSEEHPGVVFAAADIKPQLTVNYSKKTTTGIEDITVAEDENAPVEYYNLQGVRISEPAAGQIVIRRQGSKVSKVYVK